MPRGYPINREEALAKRSQSERDPVLRFWEKVEIADNGCWLWEGAIVQKGYSHFWWAGKVGLAHRFAYAYFRGETIPEGLEIDHLCRTRHCVNPWHLEPVTPAINSQRGDAGKHQLLKTHCPRGHPYNDENTYVNPRGYRFCRICHREANRSGKVVREIERR